MSVALRIWAPMLALRGADGAPAMGADLLPPEQRKALELRLAADFVRMFFHRSPFPVLKISLSINR